MNVDRVARFLQFAIAAFVVAVLVSQALLFVPPLRSQASVAFVWTPATNGSWVGHYEVSADYSGHFVATALTRPTTARSDVVYFYFDRSYPISYSDIPDWFGLSQHLGVVAAARGLPMEIHVVNADQLARVLLDPTTVNATVIFSSGVLPGTVFSAQINLLAPWIRAGGLVVWAGDQIGAYSGFPNQPLACGSPGTLGQAGTARLLNASWLRDNASLCAAPAPPSFAVYGNETAVGAALGVGYPYGIPVHAFWLDRLQAGGGLALGGRWNGSTNVAYLPEGAGGLLDFVAPATDPIRLSISINNLWQSGVLSPGADPMLGSRGLSVGTGTPQGGEFWFPPAPSGERDCLFITQSDYLAPFGTESCAPAH